MAFRAMRDSEVAAKVFGINISYYKVLAFVISSFLAGVAGAMYGHSLSYLHPDMFGFGCPLSFLLLHHWRYWYLVGPCARFRPVGHCPQTIWYKTGSHGWSPLRCHPHLSVLFLPRGLSELIMRINKLFKKEEGERS